MRCQVLIDWLTFTVKTDKPEKVISEYLGMDPDLFQEQGFGINGYRQSRVFSNIIVSYDGQENIFFKDMGVNVSMSGKGCRAFETYSRLGVTGDKSVESVAFMALFQKLDSTEDAHITRLDVACDDKAGMLDIDEIRYRFDEHLIRTRCKKKRFYDGQDGKTDDGKCLYIGSQESEFRTRIYDKALEQGVEGHWIRVEMVMRGKNGDRFISQLVNGVEIGSLAAEVMNDKFTFIEDDDSNISRCSVCTWWIAFVEEVGKVRLVARVVIQRSISQIGQWVENQVGPSLYILAQTIGFPEVFRMALNSKDRLSRKQEALIADWNSIQKAEKAMGNLCSAVG